MELVCTIGPKVNNYDDIKSYIDNGMTIPRFNFSHADYDKFDMLLKYCDNMKFIMGDLQGNKIRVSKKFKGEAKIYRGCRAAFCLEKDYEELYGSKFFNILIPISYEGAYEDFNSVTHFYMKDAAMIFKVSGFHEKFISTFTIQGGIIRAEKGVNAPNLNRNFLCLTKKDKKDIEWGIKRGVNMFVLSFVTKKDNVIELRKYINYIRKKYGIKEKIKVYSKVECREALENFEDILNVSDGIILGRGDLKGELKIEEIPKAEENIVKRMKKSRKNLFIATYLLDTMTRSLCPSLGEIKDIYDFTKNKVNGFILCTELTIARRPEKIIKALNKYMNIYLNS